MTVTIYGAELLAKPLIALAGFLLGFGVMIAITEFMKHIDHKMDLQTKDSIIEALERKIDRFDGELDMIGLEIDMRRNDLEDAHKKCGVYSKAIEHALRIARRNNQIDIVVILEEALK